MADFNLSDETVDYVFNKIKRKLKRLEITDFSDEDIYDEIENSFEAINSRRHYIPTSSALIEKKYTNLSYKLCISSILKEGAEGETSHSENGITRAYDSADYPEALLKTIVPLARLRS